ncbi:hypothetical protein GGR57DRAFT_519136 [Xylariaceae sp. FL1272]|nr:hypothetical protein GGR57DRAFT_519136 [Xylariaceae sp. FL1272]
MSHPDEEDACSYHVHKVDQPKTQHSAINDPQKSTISERTPLVAHDLPIRSIEHTPTPNPETSTHATPPPHKCPLHSLRALLLVLTAQTANWLPLLLISRLGLFREILTTLCLYALAFYKCGDKPLPSDESARLLQRLNTGLFVIEIGAVVAWSTIREICAALQNRSSGAALRYLLIFDSIVTGAVGVVVCFVVGFVIVYGGHGKVLDLERKRAEGLIGCVDVW